MSDKPLNFDASSLDAFGAAADPADGLAAFDAASGATCVPPGWYRCRLEAGDLVTTKTGKPAYRLRFAVVEPSEHAGFTLWRWLVLSPQDQANRAKCQLAPLGLRSGADLQRCPFPEVGRVIICKVLVALQRDDPSRNDVQRFVVESDERTATTSTANRFALPEEQEGDKP